MAPGPLESHKSGSCGVRVRLVWGQSQERVKAWITVRDPAPEGTGAREP